MPKAESLSVPVEAPTKIQGENPKPGKRTTEFWGVSGASAVLLIIAVLNRVFGWEVEYTEQQAAELIAALWAVYAVGRSVVKAFAEGAKGKAAASVAASTRSPDGERSQP